VRQVGTKRHQSACGSRCPDTSSANGKGTGGKRRGDRREREQGERGGEVRGFPPLSKGMR